MDDRMRRVIGGNVLWAQVVEPLPAQVVDDNHRSVIDHFQSSAGGR